MNLVRSTLFAIVFYAGSVLAVLMVPPVALFGRGPLRRLANGWIRCHGWCAANILGIRARIVGEVPRGAALVAAKHQSMYETLELAAILSTPAVVLKRQLADIPLWGWAARRYGAIPVDRSGGASAMRAMMRAAEAAIAEGRPILIFPEGTRVAPGLAPPLQSGFAGLYRSLRLPVVPVALDSGRLWPRRGFVKRPGTITFLFGDPVPPGLPRREAEARVHAAINALEDGDDS